MDATLRSIVRDTGTVPLSWAGAGIDATYLNWGDAMSPVMVALMTGCSVRRVPSKSEQPRLAAVGTIGHGFAGGRVWFWGSGCSPVANPRDPVAERRPFVPPEDTRFEVAATRGPLSARLLGGAGAVSAAAFGDPVWLLPRFYRPSVPKTHVLGIILHLSELADRAHVANARPDLVAYANLSADPRVRLINTCTAVSVEGLRSWIDEVLACERIVTTSLHGAVVAEAYGIPCLPFRAAEEAGLAVIDIPDDAPMDPRFIDLYRGLGQSRLAVYDRPLHKPLDVDDVIAAIDRAYEPKTLDELPLIEALPVDYAPVSAPAGGTVFDHPAIRSLAFAHDLGELRRSDRQHGRLHTRQGLHRRIEEIRAAAAAESDESLEAGGAGRSILGRMVDRLVGRS